MGIAQVGFRPRPDGQSDFIRCAQRRGIDGGFGLPVKLQVADNLRRHKGKPEPVFRIIFGHEIALFIGEPDNGLKLCFTLNKGKTALGRVAIGFRHPAAIHKDHPAIIKGKGRHNMEPGIAFIGAAGHEDFLGVVKTARQPKTAKFHVAVDHPQRQINRRSIGAALEILDQLVFPFQPLDLPCTKPQQDDQGRQGHNGRPEKRSQFHCSTCLFGAMCIAPKKRERP